jgi:hypothetical protein
MARPLWWLGQLDSLACRLLLNSNNFRALDASPCMRIPKSRIFAAFWSILPYMDKKEITSPKLTANFLFWVCGFGGILLLAFLAHFVWKVF